ncbi:MAG: DUF924 family protein [Pseudomonadota bacterium]
MSNPEHVLAFWLDDVGPSGWYSGGEELDQTIRERYAELWLSALGEDRLGWCATPRSTLALLILLDQFPRNMFRGSHRAYHSDRHARAVAKHAIGRSWDLRVNESDRQFFYLPLMHSECLGDQDRAVRLIKERMPEAGADNLLHAKAHREVIRRFGRFPHRNDELGRSSTPPEQAYLDGTGYRGIVEAFRKAA